MATNCTVVCIPVLCSCRQPVVGNQLLVVVILSRSIVVVVVCILALLWRRAPGVRAMDTILLSDVHSAPSAYSKMSVT